MISVTLDTNVLVAATLTHGACEKILDFVEQKKLALFLSEPILQEFYKVVHYPEIQAKIKNKQAEAQQAIARVATIAQIIEITTKINLIKEDPDDNKILECAIDSKSDYLISNDNHLLNQKTEIYQKYKITIIKAQEFLQILTGHEHR